jgi:hypothetical protein
MRTPKMKPIKHQYKYPIFHTLVNGFFNIIGIAIILLILSGFLYSLITHPEPMPLQEIGNWLFLIFFFGFCFLSAGNFLVEITSDAEGLTTRFFWRRYSIPWEDVIDLKPIFRLPFQKNLWVIRLHALTPFHRLYGLIYGFTWHPCLPFHVSIRESEELMKRVKGKFK